jgi:phospholipid transport system transporter-binding protein
MMLCENQRCHLMGAVTVDTVGALLRDLQPQLAAGMDTLDFSGVDQTDSAALALVFSAMRQAQRAGHAFTCSQLPPGLTALAELYGVSALLPA